VCVVLDMINYRRFRERHAHARATATHESELARVFSMLSTWTPFGDNAYNINDPVRSHADCVAIHALAHCIASLRRSLHTIQHDGSSTAFNQEDLFNEMLGIEVTPT